MSQGFLNIYQLERQRFLYVGCRPLRQMYTVVQKHFRFHFYIYIFQQTSLNLIFVYHFDLVGCILCKSLCRVKTLKQEVLINWQLTSVTACTKIAMTTAALIRSYAHLILVTSEVTLTESWGRTNTINTQIKRSTTRGEIQRTENELTCQTLFALLWPSAATHKPWRPLKQMTNHVKILCIWTHTFGFDVWSDDIHQYSLIF